MADLRETMRRVMQPITERMTPTSVVGLARAHRLAVSDAEVVVDEFGKDKITLFLTQPTEDKYIRAFKRDLRKRDPHAGQVTVRSPGARG